MKHLYKLLLLLFLFIVAIQPINAQDSVYINQLNKLRFQQVIQQKTPAILDSLKSTYAISKNIKYFIGQAEALKNLGIYYYFKSCLLYTSRCV